MSAPAELVVKLLRLAAPESGGSEAERTSAALEAARLVAKHQLDVVEPRPKEPAAVPASARPGRSSPEVRVRRHRKRPEDSVRFIPVVGILEEEGACEECGDAIAVGEVFGLRDGTRQVCWDCLGGFVGWG